jgi:phosphoglycerate dehydrogenase-like enzyme
MGEHLLALMLAFARNLPFLLRMQSQCRWEDDAGRNGVFELTGQRVLVLGAGKIGESFASRASALGMEVVGIATRTRRPTAASRVATMDELPSLLPWADHVAVVLPHTAQTERLVNADFLASMRYGSYLYNVGRGPIVDTDALIAALQSGQLAGAALDVTDPEPLPAESPLWMMPNVIITAHTAGGSPRLMSRIADLIVANAQAFVAGRPLPNLVDLDAGY